MRKCLLGIKRRAEALGALGTPPMLDFVGFGVNERVGREQTCFGCWIFVGFRASLNVCSHPRGDEIPGLT
jgi:hypothetical protein